MKDKLNELRRMLELLSSDGICVAFSGGVDSSLLLTVLSELYARKPFPLRAIVFATAFHTLGETLSAMKQAADLGVPAEVVERDVLFDPVLRENPKDRCYHCKRRLFSEMRRIAEERCIRNLVDGTNADDTKTYRPGRKALEELGVLSPLALCGFTKSEIRAAARELLIPVADKPSTPCLATRFPYGTVLTNDALRRVERGEAVLHEFGLNVVRLRVHGDVARIETDSEGYGLASAKRFEIAFALREEGFPYVTLDLEGFRSGSMDEPLLPKEKQSGLPV
jgi:uncharacterized protein